jgi:hypothetical protein
MTGGKLKRERRLKLEPRQHGREPQSYRRRQSELKQTWRKRGYKPEERRKQQKSDNRIRV